MGYICRAGLGSVEHDLEALERTAELVFKVKKKSVNDKKRERLRKAVLQTLAEAQRPLHYAEISERAGLKLGRDISKGAMYNFLKRVIAREEAPITKDDKDGYYRLILENQETNEASIAGA